MKQTNAYLREINYILMSIFVLLLLCASYAIIKVEDWSLWLMLPMFFVGIALELWLIFMGEKVGTI